MRRKRFTVKSAATFGDCLRDAAALALTLAGLLFLHTL